MSLEEQISEYLSYDPDTGIIRWIKTSSNRAQVGQPAGSKDKKGYLKIGIAGKILYAHRIAWLLYYGEWPKDQIDHINQCKSDNHIMNLREATNTEQTRNQKHRANNKSGFRGVAWNKKKKKYEAYLHSDGEKIFLGYFICQHKAYHARKIAELKYWHS